MLTIGFRYGYAYIPEDEGGVHEFAIEESLDEITIELDRYPYRGALHGISDSILQRQRTSYVY